MELVNDSRLQILAERTWDLHGIIMSKTINQNGFSCCSNCSNHGRYCVVEENTFKEIKDSLQDMYNNLLYLRRVKSSQKKNIDVAMANLEESRMLVIDNINQFPEKQRNLGILEELMTFLAEFPWKSKERTDKRFDQQNGIPRFLVSSARFAFEYALIFASIYSTVRFRNSRKQRDFNDSTSSSSVNKVELLMVDLSIHFLDVLRGRG